MTQHAFQWTRDGESRVLGTNLRTTLYCCITGDWRSDGWLLVSVATIDGRELRFEMRTPREPSANRIRLHRQDATVDILRQARAVRREVA